jgi:putative MATE family efflux protein
MGLPSMIGFGAGNLYALIDTYWLSRLGPEPVAALTVLGPFLWVIHSANMIVGTGSVAIISRRYGEKDFPETEMSIKETILLKWVVAIFFGIIGFILTPIVLDVLGASEDVMEIGIVYGRIIFIGLGFNFATYSVFTAMRGVANPNLAMILMISLSGLNIILDPIMIFGFWIIPAMGVAGAAWASVISYALAFIVGMIIFYSGGTNVRLRFKNTRTIRWSTMWKILKIGAPAGIGSVSFAGARLVIMPMITVFGTGVVAAYGVSQQITHIGIMLLVGIGLGMSALMGHNLGAAKIERAKETARQSMMLAAGLMTFLGLLTFVFAYYIMWLFFEDPEIIDYGVSILRILALGFPFLGIYIMMEEIYTGVGENRPPMVINIIHAWILEIPAVYITTRLMGFNQNAVWWCITGATFISTTVFYLYFRNGKWLHVKV